MVDSSKIFDARILIVDNDGPDVLLLDHVLRDAGYGSIAFTTDPNEVSDLCRKNRYDLILLDIQTSDTDGFQVMESLIEIKRNSDLPVLVIAAEPCQKQRALQAGAKYFISKPFDLIEVLTRIRRILKKRLLNPVAKSSGMGEVLNLDQQMLVYPQVCEESSVQLATILAMSKLVEARDDETGKHLEGTRRFCQLLTQQLQKQTKHTSVVNDAFIDDIFYASALHDIGKASISDEILLKPGKLTPDEFEIIKTHTIHGAATLQSVHNQYPQNSFIRMGIQIARSHHEKWDGSGYPDGLAGEEIPLSAQIMAMADVYDALRSKRCYKEPYTHPQSRNIIIEGCGKHFAPDIVDAFTVLESEFDSIYSEMLMSDIHRQQDKNVLVADSGKFRHA